MYRHIKVIFAVLLLSLTNVVNLLAGEPTQASPYAAQPNSAEQNIEGRLKLLEAQIQLIGQRLGLSRTLLQTGLYTSKAESGATMEESVVQDRLERLERETSRSNDQLNQIQRQLEEFNKPKPQPVAPVSMQTATQGKLVVQNWTEMPHYLSVNKVQYYVQPGRTDILVPRQIVEAYLPLHESPKLLGVSMWRWTGRDYEMLLNIKN